MKKIAENIISWCESPENGAIEQATNISKHPCVIGNVCLMPDTHEGYGMPIGCVVALDNAISPNMVGVDIGCGMYAVKTSIDFIPSRNELKMILSKIRESVPVGFQHQQKPQTDSVFSDVSEWKKLKVCGAEIESAKYQIGTLGGGNHFIEIQFGSDNHVWFMIHCGSRNLGKKVADYYNHIAIDLCLRWRQYDVIKNDISFLPQGESETESYFFEMDQCICFAKHNRFMIGLRIMESLRSVFNDISFDDPIEIVHNYAALEHHYGKNVVVHRKGATLARTGITGIIPGSQGSCSYIVEGLGNEASLCSCSHGAGRCMSRKKAREQLDLASEQKKMDNLGIVHGIRTENDLDEAPSAYKNIDSVMAEQSDLVRPIVKLRPLAVIKG